MRRRTTVVVAAVVIEETCSCSPLGDCDLCAEHGIATPATSEARLPGGQWASLCDAHAYRARSAGLRVVDDEAATGRRAA